MVGISAFAARLRAATWDDHRSAEQTNFLGELTQGRLSVAAHTALTVQHYLIYEVLEQAAATMRHDPVAGPFHTPALDRLPSLAADLEQLIGAGWRDSLIPCAATAEYLARLREVAFSWPAGFVAHHYNRYLGDLSGGQFVAKAISRAYGLPLDGDGLCFYTFSDIPDLSAFKDRYRSQLDAAPWDAAEQDRIIEEVRLAYRLNSSVLAGLGDRQPFSPEVVAQVARHMNADHAADSLVICQALGRQPRATAATMCGMDADGIDLQAIVDGAPMPIRVPFALRLTERAQVRVEVTRLFRQAQTILHA